MKVEVLMHCNCLKGNARDAMHAILYAGGHKLRLLLRATAAFFRLDLRVVLDRFRSPRLFRFDPTSAHNPEAG